MRTRAIGMICLWLLVATLGCSKPQDPGGGGAGGAASSGGSSPSAAQGGVSFITPDHIAAIVIQPQRILQNPLLGGLPPQMLDSFTKEMGFHPKDLVKATFLVRSSLIPDPASSSSKPSSPAVVLEFGSAKDSAELAKSNWEEIDSREYKGKTYYVPGFLKEFPASADIRVATTCQLAPTVVFIGEEPELKAILDLQGAVNTPFAQMFQQLNNQTELVAIGDLSSLKGKWQALAASNDPQAAQLKPYVDLLSSLQSFEVQASLSAASLLQAKLNVADAAAAAQVKTTIDSQVQAGQGLYKFMRPQLAKGLPSAYGEQLMSLADQLVNGVTVNQNATAISLSVAKPASLDAVVRDVLPKMAAAAQGAAENMQQRNNMKMIGLAFHNYHDYHRRFPTGIRNGDGQLLLSWRVQLLPYLGEEALFKEFKQDEAWDSPHNKALLARIPEVFADADLPEGQTRLLGFQGEKAWLNGNADLSFADIPDGTANTLMFVQVGPDKAVPWTKPEDLTLNPESPWESLGTIGPEGVTAAFFDGSVRTLPRELPETMLPLLVDPNDRQVLELDF